MRTASLLPGGAKADVRSTRLLALVRSASGGRVIRNLFLIAQGMSNAAIAGTLVVTKRAVERHVNAIFLKLGLRDADNVAVASRPRWSTWPTRGVPRGRSESGDGGGLHADVGLRTACRPKAGGRDT
jgi:hypothetical protein